MVDGDVALGAAAEGDRVAAVVPPVGEGLAADGVAEGDHALDLRPGVLALPAVLPAGGHRAAVGRSGVRVGPLVAGVDVRGAVRVGEHEDVGERVVGAVLVAEGAAVALGVVVVDEDTGDRAVQVAPALAVVLQVGEVLVVEDPLEVVGVAELLDVPVARVLGGLDGLSAAVDDLLLPVRVRIREPGLDVGEVGGVHVLGGVDAEAVDAEREQVVQVAGHGTADVGLAGVEVGEAHQFAVLDVPAVLVVVDQARAVVEVVRRVQARVGVLRVRRAAGPGAVARSHVVDDRVDDDLHTGRVAGVDHVLEGRTVAEAPGDPVAHRLVGRPPLRALDVLGGRRDLDVAVPGRAEGVGALPGHRGEVPLEEDGGDVLGAGRGGVGGAGGDRDGGRCGERGHGGGGGGPSRYHRRELLAIAAQSDPPCAAARLRCRAPIGKVPPSKALQQES